MQQGVQKAPACVLRRGEARLQPVAQTHQLVDLGNDTALLGQRREGKRVGPQPSTREMLDPGAGKVLLQASIIGACADRDTKE